ncbi:prepilin-type N-terminal cleavage/methylation domain-containing protein [Planomonospora venezuelensis]|uniref:Type IV pilus assembly protein PilA n=1 Tax=Planomonospora venezuelensis TaxID=1999 RepID=A0A841DE77_PLAVE|nr:prepilin-type N-terminal cleavage/methylation domain-containing protein [Planomonospora venezuelensis]MBB5966714.1 type IV pilus assembly protein PilA [Planomonospora venezuelensis]GIN00315.1 hypothetical protein Pve01_19730 [Planomonospora venezuelensis]
MNATLRRLQKRAHGDRGFTLIELLVVVVIIGVLVAIAIPVYMNYREGAADKSAQSDVRGAITAVESFYTTKGNVYPADTATKSKTASFPLDATKPAEERVAVSTGTTLTYIKSSDGKSYTICANNGGGSGAVYIYKSAEGGAVKAATGTVNIATCA